MMVRVETGHYGTAASGFDDVSMGSHKAIVHCALQERKRLSHYQMNYSWRMSTPHERLRHARIAAKFETSRAAARAMGISEYTYNAHENGTRGIKPDSASRYAKKFKVTEEWLLYGKGEPAAPAEPPTAEIVQLWDRVPKERRALALDVLKRFANEEP